MKFSAPGRRPGLVRFLRSRRGLVLLVLLAVVAVPSAARSVHTGPLAVQRTAGYSALAPGGGAPIPMPKAGVATHGNRPQAKVSRPTERRLVRAHGAVFDVRTLKST